jgi:hypothetical protein
LQQPFQQFRQGQAQPFGAVNVFLPASFPEQFHKIKGRGGAKVPFHQKVRKIVKKRVFHSRSPAEKAFYFFPKAHVILLPAVPD